MNVMIDLYPKIFTAVEFVIILIVKAGHTGLTLAVEI